MYYMIHVNYGIYTHTSIPIQYLTIWSPLLHHMQQVLLSYTKDHRSFIHLHTYNA